MPHSMAIPKENGPVIVSAAAEREAKQVRLEKALSELLKRGDVSNAYQVLLALFVVQHSQARRIHSEEQLDQIIPALEKNAKAQAASAKHWGWMFTTLGSVASLVFLAKGHELIPSAFSNFAADMNKIENRIPVANPLKEFISSFGQGLGAKSQADQMILENEKKRLDLTSQRVHEISSGEANKLAKMIDSIQRALEQSHQGFSQMTNGR